MPVSSGLPHRHVTLRYPPAASGSGAGAGSGSASGTLVETVAEESYQLLELPAEILKQVEGMKSGVSDGIGSTGVFPLTIKGRPSDDAVLCTPTSTFTLRTVGISNSLLVCRTPSSSTPLHSAGHRTETDVAGSSSTSAPTLQVRDICHQILECVPIAPNLERIRTVLRDSAWEGMGVSPNLGKRKRGEKGKGKGKTWTREQLASVIQASEVELTKGLKERDVIEVEGRMLLLPPHHLKELLTIVLSLLTIHQTSPSTPNVAPRAPIIQALEEDHEVPRSISAAVLNLFSISEEARAANTTALSKDDDRAHDVGNDVDWYADIPNIVKQIGNALLVSLKDHRDAASQLTGQKRSDEFVEEWKIDVGETWAEHVDLKLLEGEHLLTPPPVSLSSFSSPSPLISHFPLAALPSAPATRFADLFLTRPRWRPEEILPFLRGLTRDGDVKERDKLVQKFVRVVKEPPQAAHAKGGAGVGKDGAGGIWWYPRRTG